MFISNEFVAVVVVGDGGADFAAGRDEYWRSSTWLVSSLGKYIFAGKRFFFNFFFYFCLQDLISGLPPN